MIKHSPEHFVTISDLEDKIRDFINGHRKQYGLLKDLAAWNMLCSCLDVIGDTELAIESYLKTPEPTDDGSKYLLVYGILQTLFVQQDAVKNLTSALSIPYEPDSALLEIRGTRNDAVGHPTKRGGGRGDSFSFIVKMQLSIRSFQIFKTVLEDDRPFISIPVDIPDLIQKQQNLLGNVLNLVVEKLKLEEQEHRSKYMDKKLTALLPATLGYAFGAILESINGSKPFELGVIHIREIDRAINGLKIALAEIGELESSDGFQYELEQVDYPLKELIGYFEKPNNSYLNQKSAYIFSHFLKAKVGELKAMAKDIDEEYSTPV